MKRLDYGVEKRIKLTSGAEKFWQTDRVQVFALAEDSETPYVIIRQYDYCGDPEVEARFSEIILEDVTAAALIKQLQKALSILPSSK